MINLPKETYGILSELRITYFMGKEQIKKIGCCPWNISQRTDWKRERSEGRFISKSDFNIHVIVIFEIMRWLQAEDDNLDSESEFLKMTFYPNCPSTPISNESQEINRKIKGHSWSEWVSVAFPSDNSEGGKLQNSNWPSFGLFFQVLWERFLNEKCFLVDWRVINMFSNWLFWHLIQILEIWNPRKFQIKALNGKKNPWNNE